MVRKYCLTALPAMEDMGFKVPKCAFELTVLEFQFIPTVFFENAIREGFRAPKCAFELSVSEL